MLALKLDSDIQLFKITENDCKITRNSIKCFTENESSHSFDSTFTPSHGFMGLDDFIVGYYQNRGLVYFSNLRFYVYNHITKKILFKTREFESSFLFSFSKNNVLYVLMGHKLFKIDLQKRKTTEMSNSPNENLFGRQVAPSPDGSAYMSYRPSFSLAYNKFKQETPY